MHRSARPLPGALPGTLRGALAVVAGVLAALVPALAAAQDAGPAASSAAVAGASGWPAPGDPWPAPLDGPVILVDTGAEGLALAGPDVALDGAATADGAPALGAALPPDAGDVGAGECFAEVRVPASWRLEPVEVVVREAAERFEITPARLVETTREVVVRDAHERVVAIQPKTRVQAFDVEHRPAGSRLVRGTLDGDVPPSPAELDAIAASGLDPAAVPVGACVHEWHEPVARRTSDRRVLVREASERLEVEPAAFERVRVPVETRPAHARLVEIPAARRGAEREVLVEPASTAWVPGEGPIERIDAATGQLMCRVDVPARFASVDVETVETPAMVTAVEERATIEHVDAERLAGPARERRYPMPAEFEVLTLDEPLGDADGGDWTWLPGEARPLRSAHERTGRAVCRRAVPAVTASWERESVAVPGRFERSAVPAETVRVDVLELAAQATSRAIEVPADAVRLTKRTRLSEERLEWRPVLCRTNVTDEIVTRLQLALEAAGHSPDGVDGLLGPGTRAAMERYQRERGLATGGLTLETLDALDVALAPVTVPVPAPGAPDSPAGADTTR